MSVWLTPLLDLMDGIFGGMGMVWFEVGGVGWSRLG